MLQKFGEVAATFDITISIYVSENSDTSEISNTLQKNFPSINVLRSDIRFASAEENLFYAIQKVGPGIVWIFGDDDQISFENIPKLFENIPKLFLEGTKAIFLHDTFVSEIGEIIYSQSILSNQETRQVSVEILVLDNGVLNGLAGFSNWILKIDKEDLDTARKINFNSNAIYSHVFWILSIIKDQEIIDIQIPIIYYTKNLHDSSGSTHWRDYTKIIGKTEAYPWTINLITQFENLIKNRIVSKELIREIIESDKFGNQFALVDHILVRFLEDLYNYRSPNQIQQDLDLVLKFIIENNLTLEIVQFALVDFSANLQKSNFSSKQIQSSSNNFLKVLDSCKTRYGAVYYSMFYLETWASYIFRKKNEFFAISRNNVLNSNPEIIRSANLSDLLVMVEDQALKAKEQFVPPFPPIANSTYIFLESLHKQTPRIVKILLRKVLRF